MKRLFMIFLLVLPIAFSVVACGQANGMIWMPVKDTFTMPCRTFSVGRYKGGEIKEEQ